MERLLLENGRLYGVKTSEGELPAEVLVLAIGHSARDTFEALEAQQVFLEPKPFSVGVRIEQRQQVIDYGLYGAQAGHPLLPKGEYQLSWRDREGPGRLHLLHVSGRLCGGVLLGGEHRRHQRHERVCPRRGERQFRTGWSRWTPPTMERGRWPAWPSSESWSAAPFCWAARTTARRRSRSRAFWKGARRIFRRRA